MLPVMLEVLEEAARMPPVLLCLADKLPLHTYKEAVGAVAATAAAA
jgi:hypothetical protein